LENPTRAKEVLVFSEDSIIKAERFNSADTNLFEVRMRWSKDDVTLAGDGRAG